MWGKVWEEIKMSGEAFTVASVMSAMHISTKWSQVGSMTFIVSKDNVS